MNPHQLTLHAFQSHIAERYLATDKARGPAKTFLYLTEEFGELATAIAQTDKSPNDPATRANLEEEFADVIAWLCTMANILDVDLSKALHDKYLGTSRPEGTK
jgi:NTP pyrophosphatase (non-canonical NTP hydrolase)